MPDLPICKQPKTITGDDVNQVFWVMLFPDDEVRRDHYVQGHAHLSGVNLRRAIANIIEPIREIATVSTETLLLLCKDGVGPIPERSISTRWRQVETTAAQFLIVHSLAHHAPEHASQRKAAHLMECQSKKGWNRSQISDAWSTFKPVVHLWAAFAMADYRFVTDESVGYTAEADFHAFLYRAEALRAWGESHYSPPRRKGERPLLDPETTWRVPENMTRPEWRPEWPATREIFVRRISDRMMQDLDEYEAPARAKAREVAANSH